jgi:RHS repeat-associated protein
MQMVGRYGSTDSYRYGFQGQETDDEVTGSESHVAFKYRIHDARLGRFLSVDPLSREYAHNSPYAFAENKVVQYIELEGAEVSVPVLHEQNKVQIAHLRSNGYADSGWLDALEWLNGFSYGAYKTATLEGMGSELVDGISQTYEAVASFTTEEQYRQFISANINPDGKALQGMYTLISDAIKNPSDGEKVGEATGLIASFWLAFKYAPTSSKTYTYPKVSAGGRPLGSVHPSHRTWTSWFDWGIQWTGKKFPFTIKNGKVMGEVGALEGVVDFVITKADELIIGDAHEYMAGHADEVVFAGELRFVEGIVTELGNNSGHYRFASETAKAAAKYLKEMGLKIDSVKLTEGALKQ